jgi:AcrR family transcriptional regulator
LEAKHLRSSISQARHEIGRQEILRVAKELFARDGVNNTPLSSVATQLDVTNAALYHYFPSRGHLVADAVLSAIRACTTDVMPTDETLTVEQALHQWGDSFFRHAEDDAVVDFRLFFRIMFEEPTDSTLRQQYGDYFDNVRAQIVEVLKRGVASGEFAADADPELAAAVLINAVIGSYVMWLREPATIPMRESFGATIEAVMGWMRAAT